MRTRRARPERSDSTNRVSGEPGAVQQIKQDVAWHAIKIDRPRHGTKGVPARYPVERGTFLPLDGRQVVLWTQGNARAVAGGGDYFKEGKEIPTPVELCRFAGHGGWEGLAAPCSTLQRWTGTMTAYTTGSPSRWGTPRFSRAS